VRVNGGAWSRKRRGCDSPGPVEVARPRVVVRARRYEEGVSKMKGRVLTWYIYCLSGRVWECEAPANPFEKQHQKGCLCVGCARSISGNGIQDEVS